MLARLTGTCHWLTSVIYGIEHTGNVLVVVAEAIIIGIAMVGNEFAGGIIFRVDRGIIVVRCCQS